MRCIRSVKALRMTEGSDLQVVALYTDVDRDAPFVRHADQAYRLPVRTTPVGAYLDHELLVSTMLQVGVDGVWPGWGFVAESPEFVDRLAAAGITFLGPTSATMRRLGDKIASKLLAEAVNVPVTRWSGGVVADLEAARRAAETVGYPLVVKASAGGGGRGIRMVHTPEELEGAFVSAASEAKTAFGDDRLFIEAMVRGGRHIEVQIVADQHGTVKAVGCRDCSVQRRHQKVIEEAPPSGLSDALLAELRSSAERLAAEVGYHGVGTVEFLVRAPDFYFLEMNPRLQVEHGITEELTGLDLVGCQIRVARGERLAETLDVQEQGFCVEARVCAEDPDQGFLPAPGRVALFDPALGPRVRVDSGVALGTKIPPDFDSLIAKVMAFGATRTEARARLSAALRDFDLTIEGGATNKGYILDLLNAEAYQEGGVDTLWLDRWTAERREQRPFASEALVFAAMLAYRNVWRAERANFYRDTGSITPEKVPDLGGRELDLEYGGEQYRVRVFSVGAMHYCVQMDGQTVSARFSEAGDHTARVVIAKRYLRVAYDVTDTYLHVELEGHVHRFGRQTAGQVRAGAPSMVVAVHVQPGDSVEAGQALGVMEAMKMEIAFTAPVAGVVTEVRVRKGEQVAAGSVLVVLEPAKDLEGGTAAKARLHLPTEAEAQGVLFAGDSADDSDGHALPDLASAAGAAPAARRAAVRAVHEEMRWMLLGFDVLPERFERMIAFLEAPLPEQLDEGFLDELLELSQVLAVFLDVEQLFAKGRSVGEGGVLGPSNNARMRTYVRRMHSAGAGVAEDFLALLQQALVHYGVSSLEDSPDLERAVLRIFASQRDPEHRQRLVMGMLRHLLALLEVRNTLSDDSALRNTLRSIAGLRGELPNALVDTALELQFRLDEDSDATQTALEATQRLNEWIEQASAEQVSGAPDDALLDDISAAPRALFRHIQSWLVDDNRFRRIVALSAFVRRLYAPKADTAYDNVRLDSGHPADVLRFEGFGVLGCGVNVEQLAAVVPSLCRYGSEHGLDAVELVLAGVSEHDVVHEHMPVVASLLPEQVGFQRLTLSSVDAQGGVHCETFIANPEGRPIRTELYGLHPEAAERVDLRRYGNFKLERLPAPEDIYCFYARARDDSHDERVFVLADARRRPADDAHDAEQLIPYFERAFQDATRTLRQTLGARDPRRRLHWNRIVMHLSQPVFLEVPTAHRLARRLLVHVRHLGIEKTIVRVNLLNADRPNDPPRSIEAVFADLASSRLEMIWRRPPRNLLVPASEYERRVAEARRRGQFYPYEVIRMLTHGDEKTERDLEADGGHDARPVLPVGSFDEYDLDPSVETATAMPVVGRAPGENQAAVVFGVISTPTDKVPEGMRRVLILSDPSLAMGALSAPECDRVVAALDLAEQLHVPVEWIPVSSGARISMTSGTENLDATARVVRRIVTFTQQGGSIHLIITGVNVGAQSYWDALATMLMHTRGALIMTPEASMVLTGRAALTASGSVAAEDEVAIGGHERVMGPNGQAQYFAPDLVGAYAVLYEHYRYTYVVPGETLPRRLSSSDDDRRDICEFPYVNGGGEGFATIGEIFDAQTNPGRKRPFAMRALMRAVIDQDGGFLERWASHVGAETAIVWDAHLGGYPVSMIGIEAQNVPRLGYRPMDGPENWNGGTLFPQSSKKVARALNAASGVRPVVLLANLSGFDGSPESMRKLQLEYGAEIARAVVNFEGPIAFLVVSRYHGGAYVVFSRMLNGSLRAAAVEGSYASVIGGGPAAAVVFPREVRARVEADSEVRRLRQQLAQSPNAAVRAEFERVWQEVTIEKRAELAAEFDQIHTVERAKEVGSLEEIVSPQNIRPYLIAQLKG